MLTFEELQSLTAAATAPRGPQLYRQLYGVVGEGVFKPQSWEAWHTIPPLTREYLSEIPLKDRLFCPLSEVDHLRATSGTSGKPPLICPRTHLRGLDHRLAHHDFAGATLSFTVPIMPHWHEQFQRGLGRHPRVIVFDPRRPGASVRLARAAGVDHICLYTFHMSMVSDLMEREGMGERIRLIEFAGETCSRALFNRMRKAFPHALIFSYYGSTEVEDWPIGMACGPLTGEEPLGIYHGKRTQYLELIDPETGAPVPPEPGAEGDLLISAFPKPPRAFPLIRYHIGERVRVIGACGDQGTWSFTVLGRGESDFLKMPGGVLRADEVERVLRSFGNRVADQFELHRYDRETPGGVRVEVVLHVNANEGVSLSALALEISSHLRVNPIRTYADGVADGMYLPLRCLPFPKPPVATEKHKRMVHHPGP